MLTQRAGQPAVNKTQEKNQQIKLAKKLVQSRDQRVGERSKVISVDFEFFKTLFVRLLLVQAKFSNFQFDPRM